MRGSPLSGSVLVAIAGLAAAVPALAFQTTPGDFVDRRHLSVRTDAQPAAQPVEQGESLITFEVVKARCAQQVASVIESGQVKSELQNIDQVLDLIAAYDTFDDPRALVEASRWRRAVAQTLKLDAAERQSVLRAFRDNPKLADAIVFVARPTTDDLPAVYRLYLKLLDQRGKQVAEYPNLAAAIALVWDRPPSFARAELPDPVELFDYFTSNAKKLVFDPKTTPTELQVFMVDVAAPVSDLRWAMDKHGGDRRIGHVYFDVPYDTAFFKYNQPLKLDKETFSLANIRKIGGVCVHQAYYAATIGKAIGVPTVQMSAAGADVGHAWVGFLEPGSPVRWNLEFGCYEEYKKLLGHTGNPQTGEGMTDGEVTLLASLASDKPADRMLAVAWTDASVRLGGLISRTMDFPPRIDLKGWKAPPPRSKSTDTRLDLLKFAVNASPAYAPAWKSVIELAGSAKLGSKQINDWANTVIKLAGDKSPGFALEVLIPMIKIVSDDKEQEKLWEWAYTQFYTNLRETKNRRVDLAVRVRMEEAQFFEDRKNTDRAYTIYQEIVQNFADDGPFVVAAAQKCSDMMRSRGSTPVQVANMLRDMWRKTKKPGKMSGQFVTQSNWFRIGGLYLDALTAAGNANDAKSVRTQLEAVTKK
ncbi:MAG: hypothetical protein IT432_15615 [Phycisphaerales bacterium]|nr:hypothetical protein [Phycisphaerales bacterium]